MNRLCNLTYFTNNAPTIRRFSTCRRSITVAQIAALDLCNSLPDLRPIRVCRRQHLRLAAAHPGQRQVGPDARRVLRLRGGKLMASSLEIFSFTRFYDKVGQQHHRRADEENGSGVYSDRNIRVLWVFWPTSVSV